MKKLPYTIIIVGLIDILFFFPAIWYIIAVAVWDTGMFHTDPSVTDLNLKNLPENTVHIGLLVKADDGSDDNVRLSEDSCEITFSQNGSAELAGGTNFSALREKYGALKAAYVDKNGNVLGVTETAEWSYNGGRRYALRADGGSLLITFPGRAPAEERAALFILFGIEGMVVAALIVIIALAAVNRFLETSERRRS